MIGGAVGIAPSLRLHDAGEDVLLVDDGKRIDGRTWNTELTGLKEFRYTVDAGCG